MGPDQYITRFAYTQDGVFGRLGRFQTVEEEWQDNQPDISCIPTTPSNRPYLCQRSVFHRGGYETFQIMDVPGRDLIKFHRAMTEEDLRGCVGVALKLGVFEVKDEDTGRMTHKLSGISTRKGFEAWMATLQGVNEFMLHVVDYEPPQGDHE